MGTGRLVAASEDTRSKLHERHPAAFLMTLLGVSYLVYAAALAAAVMAVLHLLD